MHNATKADLQQHKRAPETAQTYNAIQALR